MLSIFSAFSILSLLQKNRLEADKLRNNLLLELSPSLPRLLLAISAAARKCKTGSLKYLVYTDCEIQLRMRYLICTKPDIQQVYVDLKLKFRAAKSWDSLPLRFSLNCVICTAAAGRTQGRKWKRGDYLNTSLIPLLPTLPSLCTYVLIVPLCLYTVCIFVSTQKCSLWALNGSTLSTKFPPSVVGWVVPLENFLLKV